MLTLALPFGLLLLAGCAFKVKPKIESLAFASGSTNAAAQQGATLILSNAFTTHTHKLMRGLDRYHYSFGPALEKYAEATAESIFKPVQIVHGDKSSDKGGAGLVLTPRVVKTDITSSLFITENINVSVDVEWTLKRQGSTANLWVATFTGKAEGKPGSPFDGFKGNRELVESAILDLWAKTQAASGQIKSILQQNAK